jgi:hypothetical protein
MPIVRPAGARVVLSARLDRVTSSIPHDPTLWAGLTGPGPRLGLLFFAGLAQVKRDSSATDLAATAARVAKRSAPLLLERPGWPESMKLAEEVAKHVFPLLPYHVSIRAGRLEAYTRNLCQI